MTEKVPLHVSDNPFYRKIYNDVHRKNKNFVGLIVGQTGSGKSYGALRFCEDLDSGFGMNRICFSVKEMVTLLDSGILRRGDCVIMDEIAGEGGADSRSFMSRENEIMSFLVTTFRTLGLIVFFIAPFSSQIDKRLRQIGVSAVLEFKGVEDYENKLAKCVWKWAFFSHLTGANYLPKPRLIKDGKRIIVDSVLIPKPSEKLIIEYEKKKSAYVLNNIHKWREELEKRSEESSEDLEVLVESIVKQPEPYMSHLGKLNAGIIRLRHKLSQADAKTVLALANAQLLGRKRRKSMRGDS
ncbi:Uncharacterised protein [uncultured archaeon]|nr:Uncharacterised protein [uncultured archaeon]